NPARCTMPALAPGWLHRHRTRPVNSGYPLPNSRAKRSVATRGLVVQPAFAAINRPQHQRQPPLSLPAMPLPLHIVYGQSNPDTATTAAALLPVLHAAPGARIQTAGQTARYNAAVQPMPALHQHG